MVASARRAYLTRNAPEVGVQAGDIGVDLGRIRERKRQVVESFRQSNRKRLESTQGLDLIWGEARFVGPKTVRVDERSAGSSHLSADLLVVNTGARPRRPELDGLRTVPALDSTSIMELDEVPDHLLIIGGGYVGLEFGQMFCRFGSQVTILQRGSQLLTREDDDIAEAIRQVLEEDGLRVMLSTQALSVERQSSGRLRLLVETPEGEQQLEGSHLLLAAGRVPNSEALDLDAAGVETDELGYIQVNSRLQTSIDGVYAVGDVKGGPAFTHISYDDYRILEQNLLGDGGATTEGRLVSYTLFTDPELGRVGLNEKLAKQEGFEYEVAKMPMSHVARAIEVGETRGLMKSLVDPKNGRILGCSILGVHGGEIMGGVQIAMMGGLTHEDLKRAIFTHPTLMESLNNLFMSVGA